MGRTLIMIGKVWVYLAIAIIVARYLSILYFDGWTTLVETIDPTNIVNWGITVLTVLPGIGLIEWGKKIHERKFTTRKLARGGANEGGSHDGLD